MMVAAVTDWIVGNTVSSVVFATFGMFVFMSSQFCSFSCSYSVH